MMPSNIRLISNIIYKLKRTYPAYIEIWQPVDNTEYNLETGVIKRDYNKYPVRRAVLLPDDMHRKFAYDLSYIAANKNFTYGAFYDQKVKHFIIDYKDIPKTLILGMDCIIIYNERQYEINQIVETEGRKAFIIIGKEIGNTPNVEG